MDVVGTGEGVPVAHEAASKAPAKPIDRPRSTRPSRHMCAASAVLNCQTSVSNTTEVTDERVRFDDSDMTAL
jgi:hypothetical protein